MRLLYHVLYQLRHQQPLHYADYKLTAVEWLKFQEQLVKHRYIVPKNARHPIIMPVEYLVTETGTAFLQENDQYREEIPHHRSELSAWVRWGGKRYEKSGTDKRYGAMLANGFECNTAEWSSLMHSVLSYCQQSGGTGHLSIAPPAALADIEEVEQALGHMLPASYRNILLTFSARVHFHWCMPNEESGGLLDDGLWDLSKLVEYQLLREDGCMEEEGPAADIWNNSLLFTRNGAGGYLGIDVGLRPGEVLFLSYDIETLGQRLGFSFESFMDQWIRAGCYGHTESQYESLASNGCSYVDSHSERARTIRLELLGGSLSSGEERDT
ncbi:SMI1/KNR4 family protein [Paenibacillus sp. GCM10023252]|uniref:SMI1/KNR4 family protein n=1 Tax=Paenibacillus sp. GCM10023252 TaxID=3252649 RepID=UPI0036216D87